MRITLAAGTALGAAVGVVGVSGAGTAAAQPVSSTLKFTCTDTPLGNQTFTAKIGADIPDSVAVGENSHKFAINAETTVGADLTPIISRFGVKSVEGTVDAKIGVAAPRVDKHVIVPLPIAKTRIPTSGAVAIKAAGTAPPLRFSRPGTGRITVSDIAVHVVAKTADGKSDFHVRCTPAGGHEKAVASFKITKKGTAADSGTSGASGASGASGRSGSSATSGSSGANSKGTAASGTTPEANSAAGRPTPAKAETRGTATGATATTGRDTRDLMLPAVGALAAAAVAFGFGSRLKNRRRATDDG
ncbi:DUF6801 domain-containing protein [Streptomyces sp. NPDC048637]|uniref:DUF6801 domain-containing protein n=1 Tax=Streptomyces sp. NPDC048637 TaxID=3155636 RepID=UPI00342180BD